MNFTDERDHIVEKVNLTEGSCEGIMGAVEACSELGADAPGQFGSAETFYGVLGNLPLPLWSDGRRIHKCNPLDYLQERRRESEMTRNLKNISGVKFVMHFDTAGAEFVLLACLICSQTSRVTDDPE